MAGLSLECGDCKTQFRSVEEAQEHAELTGHANFQESTEPVLNLVCNECGKPCRTKTESDLHTKRTGHAGFSDKTAEAAKPIVLESSGQGTSGPPSAGGSSQDMVVPEVNKGLLQELEEMGFSTARATRAIHFSGGAGVEAAVNWIVEHEDDADIDEMPLVPASVQPPPPSLTPEEAKVKAQELRERARKKKEEEEKKTEREREKERIRVGRELLEAKRMEEDNERKRLALYRKQEKEEEKRAREKIRQKLEEDKAERRRKLGLPPEEPKPAEVGAPPTPEAEKKKDSLVVRPATKAEQMRNCLRSLKQARKGDDGKAKKAFETLLTYVGNVVRAPQEDKYRKIRLSNPAFQERVGSHGVEFLEICGFEKDSAGEFLTLAREKVEVVVLNAAGTELNSAMVNPFFGVL